MIRVNILLLIVICYSCKKPRSHVAENEYKFYAVTSTNGLNLRSEPDVNSKRLTTLPYMFRGAILDKNSIIQEIQGRKGFWLKTEYKGIQGWIFSGFSWLMKSKTESLNFVLDEKSEYSVAESPKLEELAETSDLSISEFKTVSVLKSQYRVSVQKQVAADNCDGRKLIFANTNTNRSYLTYVDDTEFKDVTPKDVSSDLFIYRTFGMRCSCGGHSEIGIVFLSKTPVSILMNELNLKDWESRCEGGEGWSPSFTQARYDASSKKLYVFVKAPICKHAKTGHEEGPTFSKRHTGKFLIFEKLPSHVKTLEERDALAIPHEFEKEWVTARSL